MATSDVRPPQGLSLNPAPPVPVRVTKLAGVIGVVIVAGVLLLIVFGAMKRRQQATIAARNNAARDMSALQDSAILKDDLEKATKSEEPVALPGPTQATANSSNSGELSPEELRRAQAYQQELEAMNAPSKVADALPATAAAASTPDPQGAGDGASHGPHAGSAQDHQDQRDQNAQAEKLAFLNGARQKKEEDYLKATRTAALGPYEIKAGWDIPAVLEEGLNSDLPGEIKALVRANVYDTASGKYLLIPQGARLVGIYNSSVSYGQSAVQAVWNRIIYPDGSSLDLQGMNGTDAQGNAGFRGNVDNHYGSLFAGALLTSMLAAGFQLSQNTTGGQNVLTTPSPAQATAQAVGAQVTQLGAQITSRILNRQPTVKIPLGYRFNVRVNRDILFDGPYQPYQR